MLGGHVDFLMAVNGAGGGYQTAQPGQPAATSPSDWTEVAPSSTISGESLGALDRLLPAICAAVPGVHFMAMFPHGPNDSFAEASASSNKNEVMKLMFGSMGFKDGSSPFDRPGQPRMIDIVKVLPMPHLRDGPGVPILSLGIIHAEHNSSSLMESIRPLLGTVLGCGGLAVGAVGGGLNMAELCPRGVGKEKPVEHILSTLREAGKLGVSGAPLDRDDCISFGDGLNDLSMLRWAGVGVSMGNAESAAVTAAANLATASVEEDGVPQVVEDMLVRAGSVREFKALVNPLPRRRVAMTASL